MPIFAYARTSTAEQIAGLEAQIRELKEAGAERIWHEQISANETRPQLIDLLNTANQGDVIMVTKLDRLARSTAELLRLVAELNKRQIGIVILSMSGERVDTRSPTGKLLITMLGAVAEFERGIMLQRQAEGIAKARNEGKFKGRKPLPNSVAARLRKLMMRGVPFTAACDTIGIGRGTGYKFLRKYPDLQELRNSPDTYKPPSKIFKGIITPEDAESLGIDF